MVHFQQSKDTEIYFHCASCPHYKKILAKKKRENYFQYLKPQQKSTLIYEHFQSHFSILKNKFKNYFHRIHTEAYLIKTHNPSQNIQKKENLQKMGT